MAIKAKELLVRDCETVSISAYDSSKITLGKMFSKNTGPELADNNVGPLDITIARPADPPISNPYIYLAVVPYGIYDLIFVADGAAAAATRKVGLFRVLRGTLDFTWRGFVTLTQPQSGNTTVKGIEVGLYTYSEGTVTCGATTSVTGSGALWGANRIPGGCRIGFGSTNPADITTWYEISPTTSPADNALTLTTAGPTVVGVPYVIEEMRPILITTNATATNGGLLVGKGCNFDIFTNAGTTISAAVSTDARRACYWLKDASTQTNTAANGGATWYGADGTVEPTFTSHIFYVGDGAASSMVIFKYDLNAALSVATGASTNAFLFKTGAQAVSGTLGQNFNGLIATVRHGPANGIDSYWFVTTTRIYRCRIDQITVGSTTFISDFSAEVPPGSINSQAATSALGGIEYSDALDRLIVTTTGASGASGYITDYRTDGGQWDHTFLSGLLRSNQAAADPDQPIIPCYANTFITCWESDGICYTIRSAASAATAFQNQIYAIPIGADYDYDDALSQTEVQYCILPKMSLPGAVKLLRVYNNNVGFYGSAILGIPADLIRVRYRTAGFEDGIGLPSDWILLDAAGDLNGVSATEIQFKVSFRVIGPIGVPNRLIGLAVLYEASEDLPSELKWNLGDSVDSTGVFGFIQGDLFSGGVPTLEISYSRSDNNAVVLVQASTGTTNGTFEYWTGAAWAAGLGPNAIGTRRRFTPTAGLPGVQVYGKIRAL